MPTETRAHLYPKGKATAAGYTERKKALHFHHEGRRRESNTAFKKSYGLLPPSDPVTAFSLQNMIALMMESPENDTSDEDFLRVIQTNRALPTFHRAMAALGMASFLIVREALQLPDSVLNLAILNIPAHLQVSVPIDHANLPPNTSLTGLRNHGIAAADTFIQGRCDTEAAIFEKMILKQFPGLNCDACGL
ncbi:hypothetical protein HDU98_003369 [Podochytrium sp. JEL0797]|nr:hypothetical protein HDU98_003369 [Podochytrium sp. JEL0797]